MIETILFLAAVAGGAAAAYYRGLWKDAQDELDAMRVEALRRGGSGGPLEPL